MSKISVMQSKLTQINLKPSQTHMLHLHVHAHDLPFPFMESGGPPKGVRVHQKEWGAHQKEWGSTKRSGGGGSYGSVHSVHSAQETLMPKYDTFFHSAQKSYTYTKV